jgi:hypothetical protein
MGTIDYTEEESLAGPQFFLLSLGFNTISGNRRSYPLVTTAATNHNRASEQVLDQAGPDLQFFVSLDKKADSDA